MNIPNIVNQPTVIRQCLSWVPTKHLACPLLNYGMKKLSIEGLVKILIAAQLGNWESYKDIEINLRANNELQKEVGVNSISGSQLSRRINRLDNAIPMNLFQKTIKILDPLTRGLKGLPDGVGTLAILDSTELSLSEELSWAKVSKGHHAVKMHTLVKVVSSKIHYPEKIIPSTGKVSDHEAGNLLIEKDANVTYVMDRGYLDLYQMNEWIKDEVNFVIRARSGIVERTVEEYEIPKGSTVLRDAKMILGENGKMKPIRLVEFKDDEGTLYKVATNRWDLTATQVAEVYRKRWTIETFFKWLKQSLRFVRIWSREPKGIWNQMFLAMIAYILILTVKLKTKSQKDLKTVLKHMKAFLEKTYKAFQTVLNRQPERKSKGRQKVPDKPKKQIDFGSVALVYEKKKRVKRKIK